MSKWVYSVHNAYWDVRLDDRLNSLGKDFEIVSVTAVTNRVKELDNPLGLTITHQIICRREA